MIARIMIMTLPLLMAAQADTLRLRNGTIVNGNWLGGSTDEVRFMVDDQVQRYPRADIVEVDFTSIGAINSVAPAPVAPPVMPLPDVVGLPFMRGASGLILARTRDRDVGPQQYHVWNGAIGLSDSGAQSPVRVNRRRQNRLCSASEFLKRPAPV